MIGLVVFNLFNAVEMNANRAILDARRQADFTAAALRAVLRDVRFLEQLPSRSRFTMRDGELVVPPAIAWLSPPAFPRLEDLEVIVRDKLEQLERETIADPDQVKVLKALLQNASPESHRQWLWAHAAWHAHRHADASRRDELLGKLDAAQGGAAPAASLLLHATAHRHLPAWARARIPSLPAELAKPLLRRLAELGLDVADHLRRWHAVAEHRTTLTEVSAHVPSLAEQRDAVVHGVHEDRLLLFHDGAGALISRQQLTDALARLAGEEWSALPAMFADGLSAVIDDDTVTVVPDYLGVRARVQVEAGIGQAWILGMLGLALASISGAGLWVFYRSARRETEAARTRSDFLTMVTHELKTPLAGIRLLAEMLQGGHVSGQDQHDDYYKRLNNESVRLTMLIENVLDLGRMERGERVYDFAAVDIYELVSEAVELFDPIARAAGLRITLLVGDTGVWIRGDRHALLQSLLNVMDNARKYAAGGDSLDIEVSRREYTCEVLVRDRGPGIPESERHSVFDRFQRGVRHTNGSIPGVGLGLYLARTILRNHGGDLEAIAPRDSGPGVCIRFVLPITMTESRTNGSSQER